jgi:ADP-heptose:LPS heptosyltransferase
MILVIHPGTLGDVLQAIPALAALRALPEGRHLTFAGQERLGRLLAGTGVVDSSLRFEGLGLETLFAGEAVPAEVRSRLGGFARVVSWFGSRADGFAERLRAIAPEALVATPVPDMGPPPTVWEHLVATLAPWGVKAPSAIAPLALPEAWRAEARLALSRFGRDSRRPLLVVHPGAGGRDKRWPAENFVEVIRHAARETGCQVLVHRGPADGNAVDQFLPLLDLPAPVLVEPSLERLAAVLQEADAYLGADSGVSHLAAAAGAPAVILFPPRTRDRWAPWSPSARALPLSTDRNGVAAASQALVEGLKGRAPAMSRRTRLIP